MKATPAHFVTALLLAALTTSRHAHADSPVQPLPRLQAVDGRMVDPGGKPVTLHGTNLGNWLVIETWMLGWSDVPDQYTILDTLRTRFGREEGDRLLGVYRDNFITQRDLDNIKSLGFNLVRLPLGWDNVQADDAPYGLRPDAFKYIDRAIDMAEKAGLYVVIDLHGAPGGQSREHHTMRAGQNKLWSDPENQRRTVQIWHELSKRYGGRSSVVAYDLLNEPWGDYQQDLRADMLRITSELYATIRKNDPHTLIFLPGLLGRGLDFYGDPRQRGWTNVGFTEHHYPGLFGDKPGASAHQRKLQREFPEIKARMDRMKAVYFIGEFNPVLDHNGGDAQLRQYFDACAANGWMATQWAYKLVKEAPGSGPDNWYLFTNDEPLPKVSVLTSSKEEIEAYFKSMGTMRLTAHDGLKEKLTSPMPPTVTFPPRTGFLTKAPDGPVPDGWTLTNVGNSTPGGGIVAVSPAVTDGKAHTLPQLTIAGNGDDIWTTADSFTFLHKPLHGDAEMTVTIRSVQESDQWAKVGLMVRRGTGPSTGHVFVNVFPQGQIALSTRTAQGEVMTEKNDLGPGPFPIRLRLAIKGDTATGYYSRGPATEWKELGAHPLPKGNEPLAAGLAVCAHDGSVLTQTEVTDFAIR